MLSNLEGRIEEAVERVRQERERIDSLWSAMSKKWRLQLLQIMAAIHLAGGDHAAAIEMVNRILNDSESSTDEYGAAMLLALVAHVEAGNTGWLDAAFRSATRHLSARGRYHRTEKAMIAGLRRVLQARDTSERHTAFLQLHERLAALFTDPRERTVLASFDLLSWTRAHATGVAFAALIGGKGDLHSRETRESR
jgi:hypothetical protein